MKLCDACQSIDIRDLLQSYHDTRELYLTRDPWTGWSYNILKSKGFQAHHANITALHDAVKIGCEFCRMVWAHHCHFWSQKSDIKYCVDTETHESDDCACKRCRGPLLFSIHQGIGRHHHCLRLVVLVMPDDKGKRDPNICNDVGVIAKLNICTAKGRYPEAGRLREYANAEKAQRYQSETHISLKMLVVMNCLLIYALRDVFLWRSVG